MSKHDPNNKDCPLHGVPLSTGGVEHPLNWMVDCTCPAPDAVEFHSLDELCDMDAGQKNSYVIELQTEITRLRRELDDADKVIAKATEDWGAENSMLRNELDAVREDRDKAHGLAKLGRHPDDVAALDAAYELLRVAKCPNKNCIDGAYPFGPDGEPHECEWCAERATLIGDSR